MAEITTTQAFSDGDTVTATKLNNITGNASIQTEAITNRSAETTVDQANDLLLMYDASATALKKVTLSNVIKAGTASNFPVTGNATIGGTLGVTGASTLSGNTSVGGTLGVTGASTLSSTLAVTGAITASSTINGTTIPNSKTLVTTDDTQTLANKTLTTPAISQISNTGTLTLPTSTDTLVGRATTDTLTNKTLTSPVISSISNTGTLTLPTSTDTLVGRATTDTLTNKTLTSPTISGGTINNAAIGGTTPAAGSFTTISASGLITANGGVSGNLTGNASGSSGSCTGNSATATALQTGRTFSLTGDATGTSASFNGSANASIPVTLSNSGVTAGTYTKVTVDSKGRITSGTTLSAGDVPTLNQNTTGSAASVSGSSSNGFGTRTIQSGGSPSGGSNGDIVYIY